MLFVPLSYYSMPLKCNALWCLYHFSRIVERRSVVIVRYRVYGSRRLARAVCRLHARGMSPLSNALYVALRHTRYAAFLSRVSLLPFLVAVAAEVSTLEQIS